MKSWFRQRTDAMNALDNLLSAEAKQVKLPPDLHESIMSSVQAEKRRGTRGESRRHSWARWVLPPALATGVMLAIVLATHGPSPTAVPLALSAPGTTLDFGNAVMQSLPGAVTGLSDELEKVQKDLDKTTEFLFAQIP